MSEAKDMFALLRQSADARAVDVIEQLVAEAPDHHLCRINAPALAASRGLDEEPMVAAFLHAARIGMFDISWNVLCPGCGGVLDTNATLKTVQKDEYTCALCADAYEPTLDEMVEVTFTVSPRVRKIAAHNPEALPLSEYYRQMYWGSGVDVPDENYEAMVDDFVIDHVDLAPDEKAVLSVQLPAEFVIIFEPVTHSAQFIDVKGEPTRERQTLSLTYDLEHTHNQTLEMRPGPLRLALENRTGKRVLPSVIIASDTLHNLLHRRRPFLTAKRLLSNQTFRDLYRTDTLDVAQRLKITSLTFLFTDLEDRPSSTSGSAISSRSISCRRISRCCTTSSRPRPGRWSRRSATRSWRRSRRRTGQSRLRCACATRCRNSTRARARRSAAQDRRA